MEECSDGSASELVVKTVLAARAKIEEKVAQTIVWEPLQGNAAYLEWVTAEMKL